MKGQPLILSYAEYVVEREPESEYREDLNLNVDPNDNENTPFCLLNKNLWAQKTKTLASQERDD